MSQQYISNSIRCIVYRKVDRVIQHEHEAIFQRCEMFRSDIIRHIQEDTDLDDTVDSWKSKIKEDGASSIVLDRTLEYIQFSIKGTLNERNTRLFIHLQVNCIPYTVDYRSDYPISSLETIQDTMRYILKNIYNRLTEGSVSCLFHGMCNEIDIKMHELNTTYWK